MRILIKEAEASKARILDVSGKDFSKYSHYDMEYEYDNTNEQENLFKTGVILIAKLYIVCQ